ncbi:hypothetical protein BKA70DRAFT_193820 [Coprinopsis sp. MPI-PUGE-AT-0042]|nr:hypothetical protein BKA70DRAFT_193820 [Coprinopsis sp. MPI-PUGE-AT-0042]
MTAKKYIAKALLFEVWVSFYLFSSLTLFTFLKVEATQDRRSSTSYTTLSRRPQMNRNYRHDPPKLSPVYSTNNTPGAPWKAKAADSGQGGSSSKAPYTP